jgi:hypothetical protein
VNAPREITLRDAIARRVAGPFHCEQFGAPATRHCDVADDVLAMPEMQAIRRALRDAYSSFDGPLLTFVFDPSAAKGDLPESVIAWMEAQ